MGARLSLANSDGTVRRVRTFLYASIGCALVCAARVAHTAPEKATIASQSDLPHFSYPISGSASALVDARSPGRSRYVAR